MGGTAAGDDWLTGRPIAHRGLHDAAAGMPENSLAAFHAACEAGYAIELDVRLSADRLAMVFHDATLDRLCGRPGRVDATTAADLGRLALGTTGERIPTLAQALEAVAGRAPLLIEIKNYGDQPVGPLEAATLAALQGYAGAVALQSFSPHCVDWLRSHAPQVRRGQIATVPAEMRELDPAGRRTLEILLANRFGDPQFVAYDVRHLPSPLTEEARGRGLPVLTWTVRTAAERARAATFADNVIFEAWRP